MNTKTILAVAATFVGSVTADPCLPEDQTTAYSKMASVLSLSSFQGCSEESGFSLLDSPLLPDDTQYMKMCASDNCQSLIASVAALNPPNCDLTVPTSGLVLNVYNLVNGFSSKCASMSTTSADPTTDPTATTESIDTTSATETTTEDTTTDASATTPDSTTPVADDLTIAAC